MYSLILHGRKSSLELQKWRHFSVSLQNAFAFSSSTVAADKDGGKGKKSFSVSYLVDSLGLTNKLAESIWKKVVSSDSGKGNNPDSVLSLLRSHGFTDSHISNIVKIYPKLLLLDAEKSIGPKLEFLQSKGAASSSDVFTEILSKVPKILGMKEDKTISTYYDIAKEIVEADKSSKHEKKLFHSSLPEGSRQENKMRNLLVLRDLGVPQNLLFSLLISNFGTLCGKQRFEDTIKKVVQIGIDPTTYKFVQALNVVYQLSDKAMEEKVSIYITLGFDVGDVWEMFNKFPVFMGFSEKKILNLLQTFLGLGFTKDEFVKVVKQFPQLVGLSAESVKQKTEFLVKNMNWPLKSLVSNPVVFGCSMEKRIAPRCNVVKSLMSKGLLGSELPLLSSVLVCTDETFLERFVRKHNDKQLVTQLIAIFNGARVS